MFGLMGYWMLTLPLFPRLMVMLHPLARGPSLYSQLCIRIWASARMGQLDGWFKSWVPDSVFSAGGGRGSVEAWYTSALDIEEVLTGANDSDVDHRLSDFIHAVVAHRRDEAIRGWRNWVREDPMVHPLQVAPA